MQPSKIVWLFLFLLLCCGGVGAQMVQYGLLRNWTFTDTSGKLWPAAVPGNIHTDLLHNRLIPDLFFGNNEQQLQWIGQKNWTYTTSFDVPDSVWNQPNINLCFDGLDTYAFVTLNGKPLLQTNNMFRAWEAGVKSQLKRKHNILQVVFYPPQAIADSLQKHFPVTLPTDSRVFTRKAPYHYGWDWGPIFITCGILKPVYLKAWNNQALENVWIKTENITATAANIKVQLSAAAKSTLGRVALEIVSPSGNTIARKTLQAVQKSNLSFNIPKPDLWQCNGTGNPHLYQLIVRLQNEAGETVQENRTAFGIRDAQWVQEPDSAGRSFYLQLNGEPVFVKGANYIPSHSFPGVSISGNALSVQASALKSLPAPQLLAYCKEAHINMIRIWGGGIYETDDFYDLCDAYGIMVWQDFMFACAMYPWDKAFLSNVKAEIIQQVKRLRNHPCIVLWCGNNEVDEAWHNWGWDKQYSTTDQQQIGNGYQRLFVQLIPDCVKEYDGTRTYIASSPEYGWGRAQSMTQGDSHYWGVWWGMQPIDTFKTKVPRFMSEYGMQALPAVSVLQTVVPPGQLDTASPLLRNHQKHPTGFANLSGYLKRYFPATKDFEGYTYYTQLLQAATLEKAIVAQRTAMPYCMGSLYWQLNDCWPVISWSTVDFYGGWKAGMYRVTALYAPLLPHITRNGKTIKLDIINDSAALQQLSVGIQVAGFDGNPVALFNQSLPLLQKGVTHHTFELPDAYIDWNKVYIQTEIWQEGRKLSSRIQVPAGYREVQLPESHISYHIQGDSLVLYSDKFARNVTIQTNNPTFRTSDNYFDLPPATRKAVALIHFKRGDVIRVGSFIDRKK